MIETLAEIDAPDTADRKGFNCGIVLQDGVVVEAAPIVGYMKKGKWSRARVRDYCAGKGWKVSVVWEMQREAGSK
jgi:hypothetical protein